MEYRLLREGLSGLLPGALLAPEVRLDLFHADVLQACGASRGSPSPVQTQIFRDTSNPSVRFSGHVRLKDTACLSVLIPLFPVITNEVDMTC